MENLQNNYIESYMNLQHLLYQEVENSCNDDFLSFIRLMAPSLVSGFKMGRHIEVISDKLQQVEEGDIKRLMVFLPPRSSKSMICSKLFLDDLRLQRVAFCGSGVACHCAQAREFCASSVR